MYVLVCDYLSNRLFKIILKNIYVKIFEQEFRRETNATQTARIIKEMLGMHVSNECT